MDVTKDIVKVFGVEVDGEFAQAIKQAITMSQLPYTVKIHKSKQRQAQSWCQENFGAAWNTIDNKSGNWCCFWSGTKDYEHYDFHFLNERNMVWFALKWT